MYMLFIFWFFFFSFFTRTRSRALRISFHYTLYISAGLVDFCIFIGWASVFIRFSCIYVWMQHMRPDYEILVIQKKFSAAFFSLSLSLSFIHPLSFIFSRSVVSVRVSFLSVVVAMQHMYRISTEHICLPVRPYFTYPLYFVHFSNSLSSLYLAQLQFGILISKKKKKKQEETHTQTRKRRWKRRMKTKKRTLFMSFALHKNPMRLRLYRLYYFRFIIYFPVPFISFAP